MDKTYTTKYLGAYNPDNQIWKKIEDIELYKTPNITIIGTPDIIQGQVSNFSNQDYLQFAFLLDFTNASSLELLCNFTTGTDVTTQQNILDSYYGLSFAIINGKLVISLGSDGTSWNVADSVIGTFDIEPETTYTIKIAWNGTIYIVGYSTDNGETFIADIDIPSTDTLYKTQVYVGGSPDLFGAGTAHPFGGSINLNKWYIIRNGVVFWQGMDDAGIATRANISLSNLDSVGNQRFTNKQDVIPDLSTIRDGASAGATALQNTATGTDALTIEGTSTSSANATNIGKSSTANVSGTAVGYNANANQVGTAIGTNASASNYAVAIGSANGTGNNADASGSSSIAIGYNAKASATSAIQIGTGTNSTANTTQIGNYPVLDASGTVVSNRLPFATNTSKGAVIIEFDQVNGIINIVTE